MTAYGEQLPLFWTIEELDTLHARVGLGPLWLASDRRAELLGDQS